MLICSSPQEGLALALVFQNQVSTLPSASGEYWQLEGGQTPSYPWHPEFHKLQSHSVKLQLTAYQQHPGEEQVVQQHSQLDSQGCQLIVRQNMSRVAGAELAKEQVGAVHKIMVGHAPQKGIGRNCQCF